MAKQKTLSLVFFLSVIYLLSILPYSSAEDASPSRITLALNRDEGDAPSPDGAVSSNEMPEWLRRTNFAFSVSTDQKPKYFFETIQPLFGTQDEEMVIFNQSRISEQASRPIYNLGFGLRRIFLDRYLLGANAFYDYQDLHKHSRGGLGFEFITDRGIEARLNGYLRISREHLVGGDSTNGNYEKVANGFDYEVGAPLPYLSCLRLYAGGYWYDFEDFKDQYGWKIRMEFTPIKYSRLDFEVFDDTKRNRTGYRLEGAVTLAFTSFAWKDILKDIRAGQEKYPRIDLHDRVLDRVVRDFDITVIGSTKTADGLTVEAGKSG
ncbi:MAG: inverse autotransporter beta domain-containing protein [Candidatus Omnitrophota bacterium]